MKPTTTPGYIYLIVEREFVKSKENVAKVGRTNDIMRRFKQYPKGSKLVLAMYCDNQIETENEVLKLMDNTFIKRRDIGRESFEGDLRQMYLLVSNYISIKAVSGNGNMDLEGLDCNTKKGEEVEKKKYEEERSKEGVSKAVEEVEIEFEEGGMEEDDLSRIHRPLLIKKALEFIDDKIDYYPTCAKSIDGEEKIPYITLGTIYLKFWYWLDDQYYDDKNDWKEILEIALKLRGREVHDGYIFNWTGWKGQQFGWMTISCENLIGGPCKTWIWDFDSSKWKCPLHTFF